MIAGREHGEIGRAAAVRGVLLFGVWVVLAGIGPTDLLVGLPVAGLATWASLRLLPAGAHRFYAVPTLRLALRFLRQSVVAGLDVAWRAFDPRLPLRPGFIVYPAAAPPGLFRSAFKAFTSLQPGTVPAGSERGGIVYHCLDVDEPIVAQLAAEEAMLARVVRDAGGRDAGGPR